jgi:hypothetical protein
LSLIRDKEREALIASPPSKLDFIKQYFSTFESDRFVRRITIPKDQAIVVIMNSLGLHISQSLVSKYMSTCRTLKKEKKLKSPNLFSRLVKDDSEKLQTDYDAAMDKLRAQLAKNLKSNYEAEKTKNEARIQKLMADRVKKTVELEGIELQLNNAISYKAALLETEKEQIKKIESERDKRIAACKAKYKEEAELLEAIALRKLQTYKEKLDKHIELAEVATARKIESHNKKTTQKPETN